MQCPVVACETGMGWGTQGRGRRRHGPKRGGGQGHRDPQTESPRPVIAAGLDGTRPARKGTREAPTSGKSLTSVMVPMSRTLDL